jgi:putative Mn2+ efflux pump MntP
MFLEAVFYGISLAMDAMAVAVAMFSVRHTRSAIWQAIIVSLIFALFQFLMPVIGNFGVALLPIAALRTIGKYIACALLLFQA